MSLTYVKSYKKDSIPKRESGRVTFETCGKCMVDQSAKNSTDINLIVKRAQNNGGVLPAATKVAHYLDTSDMPDLIQTFDIVNNAKELFSQLPASVKKLMNHDPANLVSVLSDPNNEELLIEEGLLTRVPKDLKYVDEAGKDVTEKILADRKDASEPA